MPGAIKPRVWFGSGKFNGSVPSANALRLEMLNQFKGKSRLARPVAKCEHRR